MDVTVYGVHGSKDYILNHLKREQELYLELRAYRKFFENSTRNFAFAHRARPRIILRTILRFIHTRKSW